MATLTETAYYTKRFMAGLVVFVILIIIFKVSLGYYQDYRAQQAVTPVPLPTLAFGKLPALKLPKTTSKTTNFRLETTDGRIPPMPELEKVFFIPPRPAYKFFTKERALAFGKKFGFDSEPIILSGEEYQWIDPDLPQRTFTLNIFTNNFTLNYNLATGSAVLPQGTLPQKKEAESSAGNFLSKRNVMSGELSGGEVTSEYLVFDGQEVKKAPSMTQANLVRVDFFRKPINKLPVLTEKYDQGLVSFLISGAKEEKTNFLKLDYVLWPVDSESNATYPLKTGDDAFEELKTGGGAIILGGEQVEAAIRNVYLAYLDTKAHQDFLQPIFVFEGDGGFVAYVSAIKDKWTE